MFPSINVRTISLVLCVLVGILLSFEDISAQAKPGLYTRKQHLPDDIYLASGLNQIIDSVFTVTSGERKLESVTVYRLNGIKVKQKEHYYFVKDTLRVVTKDSFDLQGNNVSTIRRMPLLQNTKTALRKFDEHGNLTELKSDETGKEIVLRYENKYDNGRLAETKVISLRSGSGIKTTSYKYDPRGNLLEERISGSQQIINSYFYDSANQICLHLHTRNGARHDSIIYTYRDTLLQQSIWYEADYSTPMVKVYEYNKDHLLLIEKSPDGQEENRFLMYDRHRNWTRRESYSLGTLSRLTVRYFDYE